MMTLKGCTGVKSAVWAVAAAKVTFTTVGVDRVALPCGKAAVTMMSVIPGVLGDAGGTHPQLDGVRRGVVIGRW